MKMLEKSIVTLGVQAVIADSRERVLLVRHGYRPGWHFPGGGVERNETLVAAIKRELKEETGVILDEPPLLVGIHTHFEAFPGDHIVLFRAARWRQPVMPQPNREIAEIGMFAIDALPRETALPVIERLAEIFHGKPRSRTW